MSTNNIVYEIVKMLKLEDYVSTKGDNFIVKIPNDLNNPNPTQSTEVTLTPDKMVKLYSVITQEKQYESEGRVIKYGDADFDLNKWASLLIKHLNE